MTTKLTTKEELERVHLRFLKVPDNQRLAGIMTKLLPSILQIYFESDFENLSPEAFQQSPKLKALEEVVSHLLLKTNNSKGEVRVPFDSLLNIFHSQRYLSFHG